MSLTESTVEDATLEWFEALGYAIGHGPHLAPGEPAAERDSFGEVVLAGRLREALTRLNPAVPEDAREGALRKVLRVASPLWRRPTGLLTGCSPEFAWELPEFGSSLPEFNGGAKAKCCQERLDY